MTDKLRITNKAARKLYHARFPGFARNREGDLLSLTLIHKNSGKAQGSELEQWCEAHLSAPYVLRNNIILSTESDFVFCMMTSDKFVEAAIGMDGGRLLPELPDPE